MLTVRQLIEIARERGMTLVFADEAWCRSRGLDVEDFRNRSYLIHPEIQVGMYEDHELLAASVFHELGHALTHTDFGLQNETDTNAVWSATFESYAWLRGFALAYHHGVTFSPHAYEWAAKQLATHIRSSCADCRV